MDESIAKLNIEHYKKLLVSKTDAAKRERITRLLAEEEAKLAKVKFYTCWHSRQCVGLTSMRFFDSAFIQPPGLRRHGKTSAWYPSLSTTASSKSRSNGAVDIGCHIRALWPHRRASNLIQIRE
jgi:hypothetical protein